MRIPTQFRLAAVVCVVAVVGLTAPPAHAGDNTAPFLNIHNGLRFTVGSVLSDSTTTPTIPATVTWRAFDDVGITLQYGVFAHAYGEWYPNLSASARQWTVPSVPLGGSGGYVAFGADVTAQDAVGNSTNDDEAYRNRLIQEHAMRASAGWDTAACSCWSTGAVLKSTQAGASLRYQFTGRSVAVIGDRAAGRGDMHVYIDGRFHKTVRTSGAIQNRVVIYQKRYNDNRAHTIELVAATSGRIDVDGLIIQD